MVSQAQLGSLHYFLRASQQKSIVGNVTTLSATLRPESRKLSGSLCYFIRQPCHTVHAAYSPASPTVRYDPVTLPSELNQIANWCRAVEIKQKCVTFKSGAPEATGINGNTSTQWSSVRRTPARTDVTLVWTTCQSSATRPKLFSCRF